MIDEFYDHHSVDNRINSTAAYYTYENTIQNQDVKDAFSHARNDMSDKDQKEFDAKMAEFTNWLEQTTRFDAKNIVGRSIEGIKFFCFMMSLICLMGTQGLFYCIVNKIYTA